MIQRWWVGAAWALALGAQAQGSAPLRYVRSAVVNLRSAAERTAPVLARLPVNTALQLQGPEAGEFCQVTTTRQPVTAGYVACALLGPQATTLEQMVTELRPTLAAYETLLASRDGQPATPAAQRLRADPREALALLEKQFYLQPSIETLAWYGGLAEDVAYLSLQPVAGASAPASAPSPRLDWLPQVRTTWRAMLTHLEQGWSAGSPWPRHGAYRYGPADSTRTEFSPWLLPVKPSLWRDDTELYVVAGEPLTKRLLLRGGSAGGAAYQAEISAQAWPAEEARARSMAGGFRSAGPLLEFLKGQALPPTLKFVNSGSYGIDGMLGTVGVDLQTPADAPLAWAVSREGVAAAVSLQLQSRYVHCGASGGMRITLKSPRKTLPLAYLLSLRPLQPGRATVTPLGSMEVADIAGSTEHPVHYQGWRLDADGDGQPDLLMVQGRGAAALPTTDQYKSPTANAAEGLDEMLISIVWANINGSWKLVAQVEEGGCT